MNALRLSMLAAVAVVLAAALTTCGGDGPPPSAPTASTLERGISADPETLDAHRSTTVPGGNVLRDIGEGLIGYTADGELTPAAATDWTISDDGRTYTFSLRPEARWSNGDAVVAEHFVFSFRRLLDPATAGAAGGNLSVLLNADAILAGDKPPSELGVTAIDELTLQIELERPTAYLIGLLTNPATFPVHPGSVAEHGNAFAQPGRLLSNGAYKIDAWDPGSLLRLSRNEHYWNNASTAIDKVNYHVSPVEATELNRYRAGELHITSSIASDSFAQMREERPDEVRVAPTLGVNYYGFNLEREPFMGAPKVRKALSMAIDRDAIVRIVGRGEEPAYSWVPPGMANYQSPLPGYASMTQSERNSIARGLLAEAGYGPDNPLRFELRYNTSDSHQRTATAIKAMWYDALGVEATLISEEFQVLLANIFAARITEAFRVSWTGDYADAHSFLYVLKTGDGSNLTRYSNTEFDQLMQDAADQTDPDRRRLLLEEAERIMLTDHPLIPIYFFVSKHLVSPEVVGWEDNVLDYHYSQHLSLAPADTRP